MKQRAQDDFLIELASEESDAAQFSDLDRPADAQWPVWAGTVRNAWFCLREDRFVGAMGGMGHIYYSALSQYARDHEIPIWPFATFLMALDDEFVALQNEKALAANSESTTED